MDKATFLRNLEYGHVAEAFGRRHLALCGFHVVSVYADGENKAPKVYVGDRMITAADLFFVDAKGRAHWVEVKRKKKPGYRYLGDWRGFEHGVDFRLFNGDYREQAARAPFWIVVLEDLTMPGGDFTWEPPPASYASGAASPSRSPPSASPSGGSARWSTPARSRTSTRR